MSESNQQVAQGPEENQDGSAQEPAIELDLPLQDAVIRRIEQFAGVSREVAERCADAIFADWAGSEAPDIAPIPRGQTMKACRVNKSIFQIDPEGWLNIRDGHAEVDLPPDEMLALRDFLTSEASTVSRPGEPEQSPSEVSQ